MADTSRDIELRLRARDLSTAELKQVVASVNQLTGSLDQQLAAAARLEIKERELKDTLKQLDQAAKNVTGLTAIIERSQLLSTQLQKNREDIDKAAESLKRHQAAMAAGTATGKAAESSLAGFEKQLRNAQTALEKNSKTLADYHSQLEAAGVSTTDLLAAEQQLLATSTQIGEARTKLNATLINYARIEREAREATKAATQASRDAAEAARQEAAAKLALAKAELDARRAKLGGGPTGFRDFSQRVDAEQVANAAALKEAAARYKKYVEEVNAAAKLRLTEDLRNQNLAALQEFNTQHELKQKRAAEEIRLANLTKQLNREKAADETRQARAVVDAIRQAERDKAQARAQGFNPAQPTAVPGQPTAVPGQPRTDATGRVNRGAATQRGFLGLRPYEVTNLGYQVNDVVGGLAQGQNPLQIAAQQSGQFFQIFTTAATRYNEEMRAAGKETVNFGLVALRWFPLVAAAAVAVSVAIGAITTEARKLASNREFTALLTTNKYAADQSAASLTKLRKELYDLGVSWEDTGKVVQQMLAANVLPSAQVQFAKLAEGISKVNSADIKTVTDDLIEGLTGGRKAFEDLIVKYPALDAEQKKRILRLYEEGKAGEAHKLALQLLSAEFDKARKEHLSKYDEATEKLRKTWHDLLEQLAEKGAFSYLEKVMTFLVQGMTNAITTTEAFVKMLESIDKRFPWLKYVAGGPLGLAKAGADAAAGLFGSTPPGANPAAPTGPFPDFAKGSKFDPRALKIDTEELRILAAALAEASRSLPEGYRLEGLSTERPGAVTKHGTPSEHGAGRAFDVRIVGPDGTPVPALMTTKQAVYDPIFQQFDKVLVGILNRQGITKVAAGGTFGEPDAGHYSIGGREAAVTAGRVVGSASSADADIVGAQNKKNTALQQEIRAQNEALAIQKARTRADQEAAFVRQVTAEAQEKSNDKNLQDQYIANKLEEHRQGTRAQDYEREQARAKLRESDKTGDTARAEAAGLRAVGEALKNNITNYDQLEAIKDKGAAEERARIAKERQDREALQELRKQFTNDIRAVELKHQSDLAQALDAVNTKYKERLDRIDKLKDHDKTLSDDAIKGLKEQVELAKKLEEAEARITAAKKGADEALSARGDAIKTINRLEELGEITLQQKEDMTKKAYTDSRASILSMADALEKTIDPTRMSATEVEKLTNQVKLLRAESKYVDPFWKGLKETFTSSFSSGLSTAFDTVSQAIGGAIAKTKEWKDVWGSLKAAAANMIAGLLKDLAMYILKAQAAKLASSLFGGTGIGDFFGLAKPAASAAGAAASATTTAASTSTGLFGFGFLGLRAGGVAGQRPASGVSDPSWWANAPRYRTGTVVGLAPDEQRAILHRGEEVLSADNPRNVMNGGGRGGDINIRNVLVDDKRKIAEAMAGAHGERVIVQAVIRNGATIRELARS